MRAAAVGKTLVAFAKQECRKFAVAFHAAMPREIRDMVYTLLVVTRGIIIEVPKITPWKLSDTKEHWLFAEFLGSDFARECTEIHYENSQYSFYRLAYEVIPQYLTTDIWGNGVIPADHLRIVSVNFDLSSSTLASSNSREHFLEDTRCITALLGMR